MGKSIRKKGVFGEYTAHYDDYGNKIGESRERDGVFGRYIEHTDAEGTKTGESRHREGVFGEYVEHTDSAGEKKGESRERSGILEGYTEHTNASGAKIGESRNRSGRFEDYLEHSGGFHPYHKPNEPESTSSTPRDRAQKHDSSSAGGAGHSSAYSRGTEYSPRSTSVGGSVSSSAGTRPVSTVAVIVVLLVAVLALIGLLNLDDKPKQAVFNHGEAGSGLSGVGHPPEPPTRPIARLVFESTVIGDAVSIDDQPYDNWRSGLDLQSGTHLVEIRRGGCRPMRTRVHLSAGMTTTVRAMLDCPQLDTQLETAVHYLENAEYRHALQICELMQEDYPWSTKADDLCGRIRAAMEILRIPLD